MSVTVVESVQTVVIDNVQTNVVVVGIEGPQGPPGDADSITGLTGDVTASGPGNVAATLANTAVTAGTYQGVVTVTVDAKGRITSITAPTPISGATKTKITYDAQGRVTGGADAAIGDISGLQLALNAKLEDITGLIAEGSNITITGTGTVADPYVISASGGGSEPFSALRYTQQTAIPASAASGEAKEFAYSMGNFDVMGMINDFGSYVFNQKMLGVNGLFRYWQAEYGTTTPFLIGFTNTTTGTVSAKSIGPAFTDSTPAVKYTTAASANSQAGTRSITCITGRNQPHNPGFMYWARVFMPSVPSTSRAFFGFTENTAFITATVNPSAYNGVAMFGVGKSDGDTTWKIYYNNASGSPIVVDTGIPATTSNQFLDFMFYNRPASNDISWWVRQKPFGSEVIAMGVITDSAEMPGTTIALAPQLSLNTGSGTSALVFEVCQQVYSAER